MNIVEKLTTIAQNEELVYEAGKKTQLDEFWDYYQDNGKRDNYSYAFYGSGWRGSTFNPKYNISPSAATDMFRFFNQDGCPGRGGTPVDMATVLKNNNVCLDLSNLKGTTGRYLFYFSGISKLPKLDMSGITNFQYCFKYSAIESIEKLTISETATFDECFADCAKLKHIIISGTIGNDISFSSSPMLDKESIQSIIAALSKTATGKTLTLSKTAVNNSFTENEWIALISSKSNQYNGSWTISLI